MTTRECADQLHVSTDFILGEIKDGRLSAFVYERTTPSGSIRRLYRISQEEFEVYRERYWKDKGATCG